jgi:mRNA-degrading endonuclease YafQ of YafQ-DinJ toxin-antitoxin module
VFELVRTTSFERRLQRFIGRQPALRPRIARVLRDLAADPFQPHLELHALAGELEGLHAVRATYSYRLIVSLNLREQEIILLSIGSHDEVYR